MASDKLYKQVIKALEKIKPYEGKGDLESIMDWWSSLDTNVKKYQSCYDDGQISLDEAIFLTTTGKVQTWCNSQRFTNMTDVKKKVLERWGPAKPELGTQF